ncbi:MAG: cyanophycin synthetase [Bacteroidales bacterium]|nr:cyanophycin synthetase [Bacteroidales bacterium]
MNLDAVKSLYFIGAGGIGMSALVRYFLSKGKYVAAYDKTPTVLTAQLEREGAFFHYTDDISLIPSCCKDKDSTLVVLTPAVPDIHSELSWFRENGFEIQKRARVLGEITSVSRGICIAGTHGKTTTSGMTAHLLKQSHVDCNAFLGGVLKNYDSNLLLSDRSDLTVIEADEYDRSFHWLSPYMAAITSADPDHLDIYKTPEAYKESFEIFTSLIRPGGTLIMRKGINVIPRLQENVRLFTYSTDSGSDFYAGNVRIGKGKILFDWHSPGEVIENIELGVPLSINIENSIVAIALARLNGVLPEEIRSAMASFSGARRRFDFWIKRDDFVLIDDYAHHPQELKASISSVKALYKDKKITGVFQPHLYSRTQDFADDFAAALSLLDEVILLDIYPAREEPIPGVTSQILLDKITTPHKQLCRKEDLVDILKKEPKEVLLMVGAGDIDRLLPEVKKAFE